MMNNKHHTTYHSFKKSILFLIKDSTYKEQNLSFSAICRRKNTCTDKNLVKCQNYSYISLPSLIKKKIQNRIENNTIYQEMKKKK